MTNTGFEDLGFVPIQQGQNNQQQGLEDLGFVPLEQKQAQHPQTAMERLFAPLIGNDSPIGRFAGRVGETPLFQGAMGAGDAFTNALTFGYGGDSAKKMGYADPEGLSYNIGRVGGHIGAAAIPGSLAAKAIRLGMLGTKAIPFAGTLGSMLGGAEEGFAANPNERLSSAIEGGLAPLAFAGLGKGIKGIKNAREFFKNTHPEKYEKSLLEMRTPEYLGKASKNAKELYKEIEGIAKTNNGFSATQNTLRDILNPTEAAESVYGLPNIAEKYKAFRENLHFNTARELQKRLGEEYGALRKAKYSRGLVGDEKLQFHTLPKEMKTIKSFIEETGSQYPSELKLIEKLKRANALHRNVGLPSEEMAGILEKNVINGQPKDRWGLINAIKNASTEKEMKFNPIPKRAIYLNKMYEKNLLNSEAKKNFLFKELTPRLISSALSTGIGVPLLMHMFSGRSNRT